MSAKSVSPAENRAVEVLDLLDADPARDQTRLSGELSRLNGCPVSLNHYTQLVNGQGDVAVFAGQVFGQVEQQGADAVEGFVAVGDEGFGAGVGGDGEEAG